jgi:hypothetical protein
MGAAWRPPYTLNAVPVYFNPGTLAANGFNVDSFRQSLIDAISLWNEESQSNLNLGYAGDTTATDNIPGAVVVINQDSWFCSDNALAKSWYVNPPAYQTTNGNVTRVFLRDSCTFALRQWVPGGPTPGTSEISYEAVLTHELGHAVFAMPDRYSGACWPDVPNSIMFSYGRPAATRHLYPIDINSARALNGTASGRSHSVESANLYSWGSVAWINPSTNTSFTPVVAERGSFGGNVHMLDSRADSLSGVFRQGDQGGWTTNNPPSNTTPQYHPASVAFSTFGEVIGVWPTSCTEAFDCQLGWA